LNFNSRVTCLGSGADMLWLLLDDDIEDHSR
jgi:hypothetical protein